jgi:hypothetical protein
VTLTESGDRLRLEAFAQPNGESVGARETGLPADLDSSGRARALQLVARRLDRAVVRDEDLDALMDDGGADHKGPAGRHPSRKTPGR